jgi:hypothetical protein
MTTRMLGGRRNKELQPSLLLVFSTRAMIYVTNQISSPFVDLN